MLILTIGSAPSITFSLLEATRVPEPAIYISYTVCCRSLTNLVYIHCNVKAVGVDIYSNKTTISHKIGA